MSNDTENYSATAASNTVDWPEGMAPSAVNDAGRESQADIRRWKDRIDGTATATGTVDAITATFSPTLTALYDGRTIVLRAAGANATTTPTFAPDSLTAKTIVRAGNQALVAGDIRGAGHYLILKYNTANDVWELMNPNYGGCVDLAAGSGPKIQTAALDSSIVTVPKLETYIPGGFVSPYQVISTNAATWAVMETFYLAVPDGATTMYYRFYTDVDTSTTGYLRLSHPVPTYGTITTVTSTTPTWDSEIETIGVSGTPGWTAFALEGYRTGGATDYVYFYALSYYFD